MKPQMNTDEHGWGKAVEETRISRMFPKPIPPRSIRVQFVKFVSLSSVFLCVPLWLIFVLLSSVSPLHAANWPAWRGPQGTGVCDEKNLPLTWSTTNNIRWKTPLPERGNSTPVLWGDRVFLTQAIEKQNINTLLCLDRANGKVLWRRDTPVTEKELTHGDNPPCSASPVTDGEKVVASYAAGGIHCYDFDGKLLWSYQPGKQRHIWGSAASPVIYRDLCILNFGPGEGTRLIALDLKTGSKVWERDEPGGDSGEKKSDQDKAVWIGSWTTPVVAAVNGRDELLMSFPKRVCAFEPKSGKEIWTCSGLNPLVYTSPLYADGIVVGMGGFGGMALAVKADGMGDVTATHRLWHHPRTRQRIGSGVIAGGHIYIHTDPGFAECWELDTGKLVWEERLKGPAANTVCWSSMVLAGDRLYVMNQGGDTFVLRASPKFELLATNSLGERTLSSHAPSNGEIFIRTYKSLWCIGQSK
jgi:outer membrane protein assembly factor BamB